MNQSISNATRAIDPVCGMTIDPTRSAGTSTYEGETFHFCATSCKTAFDAAPAEFATPVKAAGSCCGGGACSTAR